MARQVTVCAPGAASSVNVTMFGLIPIEDGANDCVTVHVPFGGIFIRQLESGHWQAEDTAFDIPDRCC